MNDELKRYPLVRPEERLEFQAFRWGLSTGIVIGLGLGWLVVIVAAWVFAW